MRLHGLEAETMDAAYEHAVELLANMPVLDDVFGWKRTTGPDWTKEDVARLVLDALREAHYRAICKACEGEGATWDGEGHDIRETFQIRCETCAGTGMVDTGTRLTTALGMRQVGWRDAKGKLQRNDDPGAGWTATPPVVPVFVEVPYTEPQP